MDAHIDRKQYCLFHGGGEGGYEADAKLAASCGRIRTLHCAYPRMPNEDSQFGWGRQIAWNRYHQGEVHVGGHSLALPMLLKFLSENTTRIR